MTLALLCSGQGSQHAEMFRMTGTVAAAESLFAHAAELLGNDARSAVRDGTTDMFENRAAQVLCTAQALAAHIALRDLLPHRLCVAGYSVGEVAAWGVAGVFTPEVTLDLAAARADAMMDASGRIVAARNAPGMPGAERPGSGQGATVPARSQDAQGMLFVRGLSEQRIAQLCEGRDAAPAIVNPGDGYVIGGMRHALDIIAAEAEREGAANVSFLKVSVASHTRFMAGAATAFDRRLRAAPRSAKLAPGARLISGIDGTAVFDLDDGMDKLARQIEQTIHWNACLQACVEAGSTAFLELGPGRALATMAKLAYPAIPARSVDEFRDLEGVRAWLGKVVGNAAQAAGARPHTRL
jgi:[acyl-carrier-protein] S-malonyltransferase